MNDIYLNKETGAVHLKDGGLLLDPDGKCMVLSVGVRKEQINRAKALQKKNNQ